jgi:hypothetical protein
MSAEFDQSSPFQQLYTEVKQIHKNVQKLLDNIKKSTNRKFTASYLEEKILFTNTQKLQFDKLIKEINLEFRISEKLAEKLSQIRSSTNRNVIEILQLLQLKLELINLGNEESDSETDAKMDFSYDIALKLPVLNDTNSESVRDFLNNVECLYDNL